MLKYILYLLDQAVYKALQTRCHINPVKGLVPPWPLGVTLCDAWEFPIE